MPPPVLLICYRFPPHPGIGGRRWAKLARYLARRGHQVHVLCARNPHRETSLWSADVEDPRIHRHPLPLRYPRALLAPAGTPWGRAAYALSKHWLRLTQPGWIHDPAIRWRRQLLRAARTLLAQHGIRDVIITGAPFRLLRYGAELREERPDLNLILDYRDPWLDSEVNRIRDLPPRRQEQEVEAERYAVERASTITSPHQALLDRLAERLEGHTRARFQLLEHGVDPEDLPSPELAPPDPEGGAELRIRFGGSLYAGVEPLLAELGEALATLRRTSPETYDRLRVTFTTEQGSLGHLLGEHRQVVAFEPPVPPRQLLALAQEAHLNLLLLVPHNQDFCTTKFCELVHLRRPLLVLGPRGDVSRLVEKRRLGVCLAAGEIAGRLPLLLEELGRGRPPAIDATQDLTRWTMPHLVDVLAKLLQQGPS